ncbi:Nitrilotriacetate monooxygenase component b [Coniochaeta hoffmannii]|uniref:Nitrilotriacetate monooxygenase component b n=1 Tax=Coniochaeta hoffmannii TaxID=91930 RepID=A0AA38S2W6_9PEZI|nr:Nitrilotriacetate monooxygenase component b [Coniochaeta hoffmannii]
MAAENTSKWESQIKRNPHPDFKQVESSRPPFETTQTFHYTQTPQPNWSLGGGANTPPPPTTSHVSIDPYEAGRPAGFNYKLLISAIVPRPIAFVSTRSADGATTNLAPFSYFQMVAHDPPMFTIGFSSALHPEEKSKDTLRNLAATGECVINIISEHFVEAANSASVNAPYGVSEWDVSGLTPAYDCQTVKCARVREAVFSVEAKLESLKEFESRSQPGKKSGTLAVVEGTRFWVREDAINEERNIVDPAVLRPVSRLGGITYGRTTQAFELPRPDFEKDVGGVTAIEAVKQKKKEADEAKEQN